MLSRTQQLITKTTVAFIRPSPWARHCVPTFHVTSLHPRLPVGGGHHSGVRLGHQLGPGSWEGLRPPCWLLELVPPLASPTLPPPNPVQEAGSP